MIVCDKCGAKSELKTYTLPIVKDVEYDVRGGKENVLLMKHIQTEFREEKVDLCPKCLCEIGYIINIYFRCSSGKRK